METNDNNDQVAQHISASPNPTAPDGKTGAVELYISPQGDDADPGSRDRPFVSLSRARDAIRELKKASDGNLPAPVSVILRAGKYFLDTPLCLDQRDSGTHEHPITWQAYQGETVILSGGRVVTKWQSYQGKILQASLPMPTGEPWKFRQLFCNGRRMTRAGWPKIDPSDPLYSGWAFPQAIDENQPFRALKGPADMFRHHWERPQDVELNIFTGYSWLNEIIPVSSVDPHTHLITLQRRVKDFDCLPWYMPVPLQTSSRFRAENILEELDRPGEWCYNSRDRRLYFWPVNEIASAEIAVPHLHNLIELLGASWIFIRNIHFTETLDGDNYHRDSLEGIGAMFNVPGVPYCGEAVRLRKAAYCRIEHCHFDAVGGNAVYLESANLRNVIAHNEISACGANGVVLAGDRFHHPFANRIEDNYIHDTGVFNKYTAGVFLGMSDENLIRHNRIEHVPHHAINLGENPNGRNVLECNWIQFADQEIADSGAINSWMEKPVDPDAQRCGHIIRYNFIADTLGCEVVNGKLSRPTGSGTPATGIYLDNESSHCLVYGNIIVRAGNAGIVIHMGKNNLIENNIIVDCPVGVRLQEPVARDLEYYKRFLGYMTGEHIVRNIICPTADSMVYLAVDGYTERLLADCDNNLIRPGATGSMPIVDMEPYIAPKHHQLTLPEWQDMGYDEQTLVADPHFMDAEHDDYRLLPDSPALKLGFQPIDISRIGIRNE